MAAVVVSGADLLHWRLANATGRSSSFFLCPAIGVLRWTGHFIIVISLVALLPVRLRCGLAMSHLSSTCSS